MASWGDDQPAQAAQGQGYDDGRGRRGYGHGGGGWVAIATATIDGGAVGVSFPRLLTIRMTFVCHIFYSLSRNAKMMRERPRSLWSTLATRGSFRRFRRGWSGRL